MGSIIDLVADWLPKELLKLHALSSSSCSLTIRFDDQFLHSLDEQNWDVMSDEWADFMFASEAHRVLFLRTSNKGIQWQMGTSTSGGYCVTMIASRCPRWSFW